MNLDPLRARLEAAQARRAHALEQLTSAVDVSGFSREARDATEVLEAESRQLSRTIATLTDEARRVESAADALERIKEARATGASSLFIAVAWGIVLIQLVGVVVVCPPPGANLSAEVAWALTAMLAYEGFSWVWTARRRRSAALLEHHAHAAMGAGPRTDEVRAMLDDGST